MLLQPETMGGHCCLTATTVADSLKKQPSVGVVRLSSPSTENKSYKNGENSCLNRLLGQAPSWFGSGNVH